MREVPEARGVRGMEGEMKIILEIELRIDGKCSKKMVRENFLKWFEVSRWKISPDAADDDYQVWIERMSLKRS